MAASVEFPKFSILHLYTISLAKMLLSANQNEANVQQDGLAGGSLSDSLDTRDQLFSSFKPGHRRA